MNCNEFLPLICGYLDGENTKFENVRLQSHLKDCEDCRKLLAQMQENDRLLAQTPEAPADLTWRIMQQVRKEPKKQNRWKRWSAVLSAAAVLAVVLLSGAVWPTETKSTAERTEMATEAPNEAMYRIATEAGVTGAVDADVTEEMEAVAEPVATTGAAMTREPFAVYLLTDATAVLEEQEQIDTEDARTLVTADVLAVLDSMQWEEMQVYFLTPERMEELRATADPELLSENAEAEYYIVFRAKTP